MNNKEKLFLLKELDEIKQLAKIRKGKELYKSPRERFDKIKRLSRIRRETKEEEKYPFVKIFELHLKGAPPGVIANRVKIESEKVSAIINGIITIPKFKVDHVRKLGYKICICCKRRIVPLEPINYTILNLLCAVCWKNESCQEEFEVDRRIQTQHYKES